MSGASPPPPPPSSPNPPPSPPGQSVPYSIGAVVLLVVLSALPFAFFQYEVEDKSKVKEEDKSKDKKAEVKEQDRAKDKEEDKSKDKDDNIRILNAAGTRAVSWKAEEAMRFSLDQVVTAINYLFVAAAAGLALVGRLVFEPPVPATTSQPLSRFVLVRLVLASLFWISSLSSGMFAHYRLAEMGTKTTFSIYGSAGIFALFQLVYFFLALVLVLVALVKIVETRLQRSHP